MCVVCLTLSGPQTFHDLRVASKCGNAHLTE
jgi:hypothetical protein